MATVELTCSFCGASKKVSEHVAKRYTNATQLRCQACRDSTAIQNNTPICVYNDCGIELIEMWIATGVCEKHYRMEVAQETSKRLGYTKNKT